MNKILKAGFIAISMVAFSGGAFADDAKDIKKGAKVFKKKCMACHTSEKGGAVKTGPNLFGVAGKKIATTEGFKYSAAMTKFGEGDKVWDDATLDMYLKKPMKVVKGTKMSFAGLKKDKKRARLIKFLNSLKEAGTDAPKADAAKEAPKK